MSYKNFYIQINNSNNFNQLLDFLNSWKLEFNKELEENIFNKSIVLLEKTFWWLKNFNGIIIWNEFCEHLYLNLNKVESIINLLNNKVLIINTSILTIYNQKYYKSLFEFLINKKINFKLIINDIGFINLIKEYWFKWENIIIWRLITKHRKIFNINNKTINKFDDQSINLDLFKSFFKKYNIYSYALDILPQWNIVDDYSDKYLYFPWWYYTSSRWCITKSTFSDKNYIYPLKACDKPCLWTYIKFDNQDHLVWKWNSVFYKSIDFVNIDEFKKYENFIFQPFFPM
jgi:hypothetical protein